MKKYKIVLLVFIVLFVLYVSFVVTDCIRLHNGMGLKPLITFSENVTDFKTTYTGLGYTICYYTDIGEVNEIDGITYVEQLGYGAEFRLFGGLIWAWVE